jgi:hypothetical protein
MRGVTAFALARIGRKDRIEGCNAFRRQKHTVRRVGPAASADKTDVSGRAWR